MRAGSSTPSPPDPRRPGRRRRAAIVAALVLALAPAAGAAGAAGPYQLGVDISHWNGTIDWPTLAAGGYSFAFAKATEGTTIIDPTYPINRAGAALVAMRFGAYHYARPGGKTAAEITASAVAQADHFAATAQPQPGDLLPVLDLEAAGGLTAPQLLAWAQAWLAQVQAQIGVKPIVYSYPNFWQTAMADTRALADAGYILWLAHYTKLPQPLVPAANWGGNGWTVWQWTSCAPLPGFAHCGDEDRFGGGDLTALTIPAAHVGAPANVAAPAISGVPQVGTVLTAAPGSWSGTQPLTFSYQWQRCDASGAACAALAGASAEAYTPVADDVGHELAVVVTASNAGGSSSASSPPTAVVAAAAPPTATAPPAIAGTAQAGQTLTGTPGTWSGAPSALAYQWRRCDASGTSCADVTGATASTYLLGAADIGSRIVLAVTASSPSGSASATSQPTDAVTPAPSPPPGSDSATVAAGQPGAVATADGAASFSWQADALAAGSRVSIAPAPPGAGRLALRGSVISVSVTPPSGAQPDAPGGWPLDLRLTAAPEQTVPATSADGVRWQAIPPLPSPLLPAGSPNGYLRDGGGFLHVVSRRASFFALFRAGGWGDPRLVHPGRPKLALVAPRPPVLAAPAGAATAFVATRFGVDEQAHLYVSLLAADGQRLLLLQRGSRLGTWLAGAPTKTAEALALAPGARPLRLLLPIGQLQKTRTVRLRITAIAPTGGRSTMLLPVVLPRRIKPAAPP